jgi:hypothetical protein
MQRKITLPAAIGAGLLALTGCGAGSGTSTATASAVESPAATQTTTPTPTPAKTFSDADLSSLLSTLKDAQGKQLTVVPAAQIDQGIAKAKELLKTATVTPEACKVLVDSNANVPDGSTYAGGTSISTADKTAIVVTVFALKDAKTMTDQLNASQAAAAPCKTFTLEAGGQKITTETTPVAAEADGDVSFAALTKQQLATGQSQTALTVTGIKGNLAATAVKTGPAVTEKESAELTQLVNTILAHG